MGNPDVADPRYPAPDPRHQIPATGRLPPDTRMRERLCSACNKLRPDEHKARGSRHRDLAAESARPERRDTQDAG